MCSRYDTVTGDELPVSERVGFLDRKLRVVTEKTKTRKEWVRRALDALRATYGFEYQATTCLSLESTCSRRSPNIYAIAGVRTPNRTSSSRQHGSYPGTSGR